PHYLLPEQARAQQLDGRSDVYSLGVVAYQSLTGSVPFDGDDSFSIGYKHIMEEIPAPPLVTYDQRTVFEIIRKMMAKSPDDRFQTADDLVQALEAGGGVASPRASPSPTPGPAPADSAPTRATVPPAPDTSRRPLPPGTPGRLTLQGVPAGARITLNGQPLRGPQTDVPPGTYQLAVRAAGFAPFERQVVITAGAPSSVKVELQPLGSGDGRSGPCEVFGPAYNFDNICFDTRPVPLSQTRIPVPADASVFPRQAILL